MMNGHNRVVQLPQTIPGTFTVPLLDEEFDPDVEEAEAFSIYVSHCEIDEPLT